MKQVYSVEMFKDGKWVTEKRIYNGKKDLNDFDLKDVPNLRRNANYLGTKEMSDFVDEFYKKYGNMMSKFARE